MQILRMSDRIRVEIGDIAFLFGPMSLDQKATLEKFTTLKKGKESIDSRAAAMASIKYTIKGIEGVKDIYGDELELEFDDKDERSLTDNSVEDILNIPHTYEILLSIAQLNRGFSESIMDPSTGEALKNVKVVLPKKKKSKKKMEQ